MWGISKEKETLEDFGKLLQGVGVLLRGERSSAFRESRLVEVAGEQLPPKAVRPRMAF